ncbi:hypothetical protein ACO0LD_30675 [Undibacterium sp. Ji83W]|uniref:hypothetical protein n=1 Tax=Undibacterium sp. Ji83W TaxID=3413043 RepID=UPI003BF42B16
MPDLIRHPVSWNFGFEFDFGPCFATDICSETFLNTGASDQRKPLDARSSLA